MTAVFLATAPGARTTPLINAPMFNITPGVNHGTGPNKAEIMADVLEADQAIHFNENISIKNTNDFAARLDFSGMPLHGESQTIREGGRNDRSCTLILESA